MNELEAHDRFQARMANGDEVPDFPHVEPVDGQPEPAAAVLAAMASMTGRLDYCEDDWQLDECVEETRQLLGLGVATYDALNDAAMRVLDAYIERAERLHEWN